MPIHHLSVLSKSWLVEFIDKHNCYIEREFRESVSLKFNSSWIEYYKKFSPHKHQKEMAEMLGVITNDLRLQAQFMQNLREKNIGSEVIFVVKKNNKKD